MFRHQVINLTRVTEKFMSSLLGSMHDGHVTLDDTTAIGAATHSSIVDTDSGNNAISSSSSLQRRSPPGKGK